MKNFLKNIFSKLTPPGSTPVKTPTQNDAQNQLQKSTTSSRPFSALLQRIKKLDRKNLLVLFFIGFLVFLILIKVFGFIVTSLLFFSKISIKLVGLLLGLSVVLFLLYRYRPPLVLKIIALVKGKLLKVFYFGKKYYEIFRVRIVSWITRFKIASPHERWLMARKPLLLLIALLLILRFGYLFFPPKIATSFPGNHSFEAPLSSKIEVIFNKGVIKSSVEKSFTITPRIEGAYTWEGDQKFVFTPKNNLSRGTKYKVSFNGIIFSTFLVPLLSNKTVDFETIGNPRVILASPQTEALEDLAPITVVFDRPMIPLTTAKNNSLKQPAFTISPEIKGEGRWLGTTAYQFRPTGRFKRATTYTVTVPAEMHSQDGGVLEDAYEWEFTSERPRVNEISPQRYENFASPTASVSATFNQDIDQESIADKFLLYDKNNNKVPGRIVVTGSVVGFYATSPLHRQEEYTATIHAGVQSMEGENGMEEEHSWSFTVAPFPKVVSVTPKNGEKDAEGEYRATVEFKTPMDEASFKDNVTIDPEPEVKPSFSFANYNNNNELSIGTYFARSKKYTITIGEGVKDQYGVILGKPYTFSFTTAAYKPSVSIFPFGTYFGAFNQQVIPRVVAQVINAKKIEYTLYKLKREDLLDLYRRRYEEQCSSSDSQCRNWQNYDTSNLEKVRSWSETYDAPFNTPVQVVTKITKDNGDKIPAGFYYLNLQIPQGPHDNMVMIVSKSALTVKKSTKQIFAWSVNQTSTNVVSGMKMQVTDSFGNVLSEGMTNNDGVFMKDADLFRKDKLFVFGQKDDDLVVAASAWSEGINRYDFGLPSYYSANESKDYDEKEVYKVFSTLDRPIYRPGQKVYFKGVIRKDNDGAYENLQPGEEVSVIIKDSNNRAIYENSLPVTSFGSFSGDVVLSKDASLGYYQILSSYKRNSFNEGFQVEEYKKPELAVTVNSSKQDYLQGDTAQVGINASYYFGAPVVDMPVEWSLQTQDYTFRWDKDWRFEFGDPDSYWSRPWWNYTSDSYFSGELVTQGKGRTNGKGDLELNLPLDISKQKTGQTMLVEAVIKDTNNQWTVGSKDFTVNKAGLYVGLKPVSYGNQSGKEAKVEVVVVDLKGNEVENIPVLVEFYKRTWETVREQNPDDGLFYYTSKPSDALVGNTSVTTDALGRAVASFTPTEGGTYKIVGKVVDKSGNQNVSGSFLWVSGSGFSAPRENNDRIVLITNKQDYFVGEDLSVFVASPFSSASAKTLLTAERGSVLDYKIVDTSETSNNFTMSVPAKYTPNAFIGAVLVKGGDQVKNPAEFKIGYSEVKVTDKKQQVDVKITTDKKKYKPKDTLKATIETKDLLGHPIATELAVGLVDKAVWALSNSEVSDIYKTFYQPRNLEVETSQLLTISIDRINANTNLGAKGGSGGGCFTADTPILMKGGVYKNIKDMKVGDVVLTRENEDSATLVEAKVLKTFKHIVTDYLILNGQLRVTSVHKMYINGKWIIAGEIQRGDVMINKNNQLVKVFSIEKVHGTFDVYNLETEKYHTYFARDIYVHNQKGGGNDTSRSNFPDTAYWNPTLETNKDGKATLAIKLPDNLTTWRLSAIANSQQSAFGSKVSEVVVSRDVLIRPFLPRFLSVGDEAKLGAIIVNTSGEEQTITAKIEGEGIQIKDDKAKQQVIPDGGQVKVMWNTVTTNAKKAKIKVSVQGTNGVVKDAVEMTLPIKSYSVPEIVATAGQAKDTAQEKIVLPKEVDITQGQAAITLSPSLGSNSFNAFPYLFDYPYYSTEYITSRFMPAVFISRVLKNANIKESGSVDVKQLEQIINDGVQRLNNQQHSDGGWGWWAEYDSDPFLSAYSFLGLVEAKKDTFTVADQTLQKAKNYLLSQLARGENGVSLNTQAYIVYVLRGQGVNLSSYASNLYERRFELSLESRAYLAIAMKEMGMGSQARRLHDELVGLAKKTATTTHWEEPKKDYYFMGSNTTATASVLEALVTFDRNNPLIPEVIRYLMSIRTDDHWGSTRDTAAVIKAIASQLYAKGDSKVNEDYRLSFNGKIIKEGTFTKNDLLKLESYTLSVSQFKIGGENKLQVTKSGEGNLYYNINLKYYLPFSEIEPLEQGIVIMREFVDSTGKVLPSNKILENTEAWVRLIIVAPEERHFVVIEDTLPAGLESVNESLKNVSVLSNKRLKLKEDSNQLLYFNHKEYHDDHTTLFTDYLSPGVYEVSYKVRATTPGRYHYPPAQAYQLYTPDVSGHSSGGWLEVREQ